MKFNELAARINCNGIPNRAHIVIRITNPVAEAELQKLESILLKGIGPKLEVGRVDSALRGQDGICGKSTHLRNCKEFVVDIGINKNYELGAFVRDLLWCQRELENEGYKTYFPYAELPEEYKNKEIDTDSTTIPSWFFKDAL